MTIIDAASYYHVIVEVSESWDKLKRIPCYDEMFGVALFERMFEIAPDQWGIFPWSKDDYKQKDPKFLEFAKRFVKMLDVAVHMLGPDMEIVEEQMYDLGVMHKRYGVMPQHFELMGQALIQTLKATLGKRSFSPKTEESWTAVYKFLSMTMIQGAASL